jgi:hypothetical protein
MNTLNLINKEKSDISYEIITFPDGEPHIKIIDLENKIVELNKKLNDEKDNN